MKKRSWKEQINYWLYNGKTYADMCDSLKEYYCKTREHVSARTLNKYLDPENVAYIHAGSNNAKGKQTFIKILKDYITFINEPKVDYEVADVSGKNTQKTIDDYVKNKEEEKPSKEPKLCDREKAKFMALLALDTANSALGECRSYLYEYLEYHE